MTSGDISGLIERVVEHTRSCVGEDFVALYAYGSYARGGMDEWSDLDLCLVLKPSDRYLASLRGWATRASEMSDATGVRVDPIGLSTDHLGEDVPWDKAFLLWNLQDNSILLLGEDVRALMRAPSKEKLRLSAADSALRLVRSIYGIPREQPVPRFLPAPDLSLPCETYGNIGRAVAHTVVQGLRALVVLGTGAPCEEKRRLPEVLKRLGEDSLAAYCADALALRQEIPAFAPLQTVPPRVRKLSECIPGLAGRLLVALSEHGLTDPSWKPEASGAPGA
jgi:predicted nucleotidyltransferase